MNTTTHVCAGMACGTVAAGFFANNPTIHWGVNELTGIAIGLVALGASLPDLDSRQSPISRVFPFLSQPISRRWPHRTLLHSLFGLMLWAVVCYGLLWAGDLIVDTVIGQRPNHCGIFAWLFAFAYASHLALDSFTRQGVRWLYPLVKSPFGHPSSEQYRIITGDKRAEWLISSSAAAVVLALASFALQGADVSLQNIIGKYKQLSDIYQQSEQTEVVVNFVGHFEHDKAPVSGRALILESANSCLVVWWQGKIYSIGEGQGDIYLRSGKCEFLGVPPLVREVDYSDSRWEKVVGEAGERVLISGELIANQPLVAREETAGRTVKVSPTSLSFHFAGQEDLEALQIHPKIVVSELRQEQERKQRTVDSLITARVGVRGLYQRDTMLSQIEEIRKEIETLEAKLKTRAGEAEELRFSGRLRVRTLPYFEQ